MNNQPSFPENQVMSYPLKSGLGTWSGMPADTTLYNRVPDERRPTGGIGIRPGADHENGPAGYVQSKDIRA